LFYDLLKNGDIIITSGGLQNSDLFSKGFHHATPAVTQSLIFSFFPLSSNKPPHLIASHNLYGDVEDLL
jgi:hypothetical protein